MRYTGVWNVLDYTAISFPTGLTADKEVDLLPPHQESLGELDREIQSKCRLSLSSLIYMLTYIDDAAAVHGMPVSLQLTGRRLQEEKVLAMTQRVLEALE
jgi:amidase